MNNADDVSQNPAPEEQSTDTTIPLVSLFANEASTPSTPQGAVLDALVGISRKVAKGSNEQAIFQSIVEDAQKALSADRVVIVLPQKDQISLRVVAHCGFPSEVTSKPGWNRVQIADHPLARQLFESGEPLSILDTRLLSAEAGALARDFGFRSIYAAPLKYGGDMMGVLAVIYTGSPHYWTQEEADWLLALADQAAVALTLRRTLQEQRRSIAVREALHTASRRLQSSPDVATVLEATLEGVGQVVPSLGTSIHFLSDDGKTATVAAIWGYGNAGFEPGASIGFTYPAGESSLNSRTLIGHEAFFLYDFQEESEKWANDMPTLRAWMSVPLIANNRCLGKITVDHDLPGMYGPEELAIVQTFAAHAAVALERARLYSEANSRATQFASLARSARTLASDLDISVVLQSVVDNARLLTGAEACLMLHRAESGMLAPGAFAWADPWHHGADDPISDSLEAILCVSALRHQKIVVIQDLMEEPTVRNLKGLRVRSAIVLPLSVGDDRLGILKVAWREPNQATDERVALCTTFADHAALAIHNALQHDEMRKREEERTMLLRQLLTAQENERKLIALELHDGPLQSLGVGLINTDALRKKTESGRAVSARDVDDIRRYFASVVEEIRGMMADLRPESLDSYGLLAGLEAYCRRLRESSALEVQILYDLGERLPTYMEVLVYRLVQEALNNIQKHANATEAAILIRVEKASGSLYAQIKDNGKGFDPTQVPNRGDGFGLGIKSMKERTRSAGGSMSIDSAPGAGTVVTFQIPLPT